VKQQKTHTEISDMVRNSKASLLPALPQTSKFIEGNPGEELSALPWDQSVHKHCPKHCAHGGAMPPFHVFLQK